MKLNTKLNHRMQSALAALALAGSTAAGFAQNTNPTNTFDTAPSTTSFVQWWGTANMTWDGTRDAANNPLSGSVRYSCPFVGAGGEQFMTHNTIANRWQWDGGYILDATTYTNLSFDIKVDPASPLTPGGNYGNLELGFTVNGWGTTYLPTYVIPATATNWTHVNRPLNPAMGNINTVVGTFFKMWSNGAHTNTLLFNLDNVQFTKPTVVVVIPPPTVGLDKVGSSGIQVTVDQDGQQWQRDAIATPATAGNCFWGGYGATPVTYSFTVGDFPDVVAHPDFETHMYIVNGDTTGVGDQTYGGCDWNAADIAIVSIYPGGTNGGFDAQFQMKTNRPNNNPVNDSTNIPARLHAPSIKGTWSLSFTHNTNVTLSGPGGVSTNFTIGNDAVLNNFSPAVSFIQFGFHKSDAPNNGHNNGISGTFSNIKKTGGDFVFDDSFGSAAFNSNYAWRKTSATAVNHVPAGSAWWVNWTKPDASFYPQTATSVTGPWSDLSYTGSFANSSKSYAAVPAYASNNYYRMIKRPFTKLRVLCPGETAAPNTPSGKTGTPDPQAVGVPFQITVSSCDAVWRIVSSSDTVNITSTDGTATLPANAALVAGSQNFIVTLGASGTFTLTATDVTDGAKTPNTSAGIVVP